MSILTTSQLTFCDLKDSYSLHLDKEYIGVACDSSGKTLALEYITINYRVLMGNTRVNASCTDYTKHDGIGFSSQTNANSTVDGTVTLWIAANDDWEDSDTVSMKLTFQTDDDDAFTFERYVTFIKTRPGKDGSDAVDFQIYSPAGFQFSDDLQEITLKTAAFQGGKSITPTSYTWKYCTDPSAGTYTTIPDQTGSTLVVSMHSPYRGIECSIVCDGITYTDRVSLTTKTEIYSLYEHFFDGSAYLQADETSEIVGVILYKDNVRIGGFDPSVTQYYSHADNRISDNVITTNLSGATTGEKKYFVCYGTTIPRVVLGQYSGTQWELVTDDYTYRNTFNNDITDAVIYVPKERISRALNMIVTAYNTQNNPIANTSIHIIDLNDPIVSATEPPRILGQMWVDTSTNTNVLKVFDGNDWVLSSYQNGNVVHTTKPNSYVAGDLWILEHGYTLNDTAYEAGTMMKSTSTSTSFDASHWVDADEQGTAQKQKIAQTFNFHEDNGLQIGQTDNKFYVNISSQSMSFYDNTGESAEEVVVISNNSAKIQNLTADGTATFHNEVQFGQFVWKVEADGSLSLAKKTI